MGFKNVQELKDRRETSKRTEVFARSLGDAFEDASRRDERILRGHNEKRGHDITLDQKPRVGSDCGIDDDRIENKFP